jgi:predicted metal-dependent phosphoesterase TrpH
MALKIDFHIHTGEDPSDNIAYDARRLIDRAAELQFDAIAITNHDIRTFDDSLLRYAAERGILLLPGMEAHFSGFHVVIINPPHAVQPRGRTFRDLAALRSEETLVFAPHPFFPGIKSLGKETRPNIHLFDALELCQYHNPLVDFNARARRLAREFAKPMVATSDSHYLWQFGRSYCLVQAERNRASIIRAVKEGRLENVSPPHSLLKMARSFSKFFLSLRFLRGLRKHSPIPIKGERNESQ